MLTIEKIQEQKNYNAKRQKHPLNMRLNLGCGNKKLHGYVNIDQSEYCNPDLLLNLENTPYPFKSSSVDEIIMNSVLEHFPSQPDDFFRILKEIYRIMKDQALLRILCPHPFHRWQIVDFTHQKPIDKEGLEMLDKEFCKKLIRSGDAKTPLAMIYDIDFRIIESKTFVDPDCAKHIKTVLGEYEPSKLESYAYLFNNIIGGQSFTLKAFKA